MSERNRVPFLPGLNQPTMIPFPHFRYIFPPRAENALPADLLKTYDNSQYGAQPKLNGDCTLVFTNGKEVHVYNRHRNKFKKSLKIWDSSRIQPPLDSTGTGILPTKSG